MWHYQKNFESIGPVSAEEIQDLLKQGILKRSSLLWREGLPDWTPLFKTDLAGMVSQAGPPPIMPPPVRKFTLPGSYPIWLAMTICVTISAVLLSTAEEARYFSHTASITLGIGGFVSAVGAVVLWGILLHRAWQSLPAQFARTKPGLAVGLTFIPLFGLYWQFVSVYGLAKDMNRFLRANQMPVRVNETLALTSCLLNLIAWIPGLGSVFMVASCVIGIILWRAIIDVTEIIPHHKQVTESAINPAPAYTPPSVTKTTLES